MSATFALVAGESSGDQLGAELIQALKQRYPGASFVGIGGSGMQAAGMDCWWHCEELAVMGLFEVLPHVPRLLRLRRELRQRIIDASPDVFIGIDAPAFNLGLEKYLRKSAIPTIHYVSPTVWAWRQSRVNKIAAAAEMVLCLFPFETAYYDQVDIKSRYVGHPLTAGTDPVSRRLQLLPERLRDLIDVVLEVDLDRGPDGGPRHVRRLAKSEV